MRFYFKCFILITNSPILHPPDGIKPGSTQQEILCGSNSSYDMHLYQ